MKDRTVRVSVEDEMSASLYERLGGQPVLDKVHKIFYDKVYADPWLRQFFEHIDQKHIEAQQTDFMAQAFGGPKRYCGKLVLGAHKHILITTEMFKLRHELLRESIEEAGVAPNLMQQWLKVDGAFERNIVKNSTDECEQRYSDEPVIVVPRPPGNHRFQK